MESGARFRVTDMDSPRTSPVAVDPVIELHYTLGRDDVIAFNLHHLSVSVTARRTRQRIMWLAVVLLVLLSVLTGYKAWIDTGNSVRAGIAAAPYIIFLAGFVIAWPRLNRLYVGRYVRRVWDEGKNKAIVGDHTLRASEEVLRSESAYMSSRLSWELVERVDVTKSYVFIYISAFNAFILPRRAFSSGRRLLEFLQLIGQHANVSVACPECGYNLRGAQGGRCPECGFPREQE